MNTPLFTCDEFFCNKNVSSYAYFQPYPPPFPPFPQLITIFVLCLWFYFKCFLLHYDFKCLFIVMIIHYNMQVHIYTRSYLFMTSIADIYICMYYLMLVELITKLRGLRYGTVLECSNSEIAGSGPLEAWMCVHIFLQCVVLC
jgi:hypothetical protein